MRRLRNALRCAPEYPSGKRDASSSRRPQRFHLRPCLFEGYARLQPRGRVQTEALAVAVAGSAGVADGDGDIRGGVDHEPGETLEGSRR